MPRRITLPPEEKPAADGTRAAGWWHESDDDGRVVCDLCPRGCALADDARGFCFVRQNRNGRMVSTTYGRSTGFCIDPIEKKPLNQFYPGTAILSFGTAGCNLGCKFCQNWSSSRSHQVDAAGETADPETIARAAQELGCRSVAFTYNDPIVWAEYAIDTARACRARGIKTVAVTSGYILPAARKTLFDLMDAANVDLKGFSEDFYTHLTSGHLKPVLDTLVWLVHESQVWLEITNLVIPGENDNAQEIEQMCRWILKELGPDVPLHFTAFHPDFRMTDHAPTPAATLDRAYQIARQVGLHYVYTGNTSDRAHQSTYCPGCGKPVIEREGYVLGTYAVKAGACGHCGRALAGHFDDRPGDWGARRQPVRIGDYAPSAAAPTAAPAPAKAPSPAKAPAPAAGPAPAVSFPRPELTAEQEQRVFQAAGARVTAAVCNSAAPALSEILGSAARTPVYGAFVSLKRAGQLRSCCGFLGQTVPLGDALDHAAVRAAKDDPRFPPISPSELGHLDMEVWLLWGLEPMLARGEARVAAITIGKHGLQIARGAARGLLLPGVAVEHKLDARRFLEQVCVKAGLPTDAWKLDDTVLMTFEGHAIHGRLTTTAAETPAEELPGGPSPAELTALAEFCRSNLGSLYFGATPSYYLPGVYDGAVCGAAVAVGLPNVPGEIHCSTISLRADKALQSTLLSLVQAILPAVRERLVDPLHLRAARVGVTVLLDSAMHGPADRPDLGGVDPRRRAVLVAGPSRSAWVYDPQLAPPQLLAQALTAAQIADPAAAAVFSLAVASNASRAAAAYLPVAEPSPDQRPPAVAGGFYPGTPAEIQETLNAMIPRGVAPQPWAAALVPHAGWIYSGRLAAATLSRVQIPSRVIVLCPKHRPGGVAWAVAPHREWSMPGGCVQSDPELARHLAGAINGLELDAVSHRQEHAIEVQLPILARLAPQARVVGIVIGGGSLADLQRFAGEMADALRDLPERPLLVISSDMNHYADDTQTRRLDRKALDAIESLDPTRLYETVLKEEISMCGMLPAVIVMETLRRLDALHRCEVVGYTTSAEASRDTSRVVGYAGVLFG